MAVTVQRIPLFRMRLRPGGGKIAMRHHVYPLWFFDLEGDFRVLPYEGNEGWSELALPHDAVLDPEEWKS